MPNRAVANIRGTVISEPTNRQTSNGQTILNMKVGVTTTKKQENSPYPVSDVWEVTLWGKIAEKWLGKVKAKNKVFVNGDVMMGDPWTDRDGKTHVSPKMNGDHFEVLDGGNNRQNNNNNNNQNEDIGF